MLLLYVRTEHAEEKLPVELPVDATVGSLKAAVHQAGGPPPHEQLLAVGREELSSTDDTLLSDTHLISSEVVVSAQRKVKRHYKSASFGKFHGLVLLAGGEVAGWGERTYFEPVPAFGGAVSVHAGRTVSAAIAADGRLVVWGCGSMMFERDLRQLEGKQVVCCSTAVASLVIAAVDIEGRLYLCACDDDDDLEKMAATAAAAEMQGRVAAVSAADQFAAVLTREGTVALLRYVDGLVTDVDLGGIPAASVSALYAHSVVLLEDGSVRCFGTCFTAPEGLSEVVSCAAGQWRTAACCKDGTVVCWGDELATGNIKAAGPCVSVDAGCSVLVAVTASGRVVVDGNNDARRYFPETLAPPDFVVAF